MTKKHRKVKNTVLIIIAALLLFTSGAAIYADIFLANFYNSIKLSANQSAQGVPVPVLTAAPEAVPTDAAATPEPTRTPLYGDLFVVDFPEYDTGVRADHSYQSDELKIAVNKVEELGVTYYVADIWMRNISCFRTAFASGKYKGRREDPEKISQDNHAILAVNGDFLGGLAIRNGEVYSVATKREIPTPDPNATPTPYIPYESPTPTPVVRPERSTLVLYRDGRMMTEEYDVFRTAAAMDNGAWQGWQFGPTLVRNGEPVDDVNNQGRSPRCMVGYYEPGHYCLVMIDGRQKDYSIGMNFEEMIGLAMSLGLKEAYNLDGGGSAVMTFKGKIINSPSGKGDTRKLPDMLVIGEYLSPDMLNIFAPTPAPTFAPSPTPGE